MRWTDYEFPVGCETKRDKRHYVQGWRWGWNDGRKGRTVAVMGRYWEIRGYDDGNAAGRRAER